MKVKPIVAGRMKEMQKNEDFNEGFNAGVAHSQTTHCACVSGDTSVKICECYKAGREEALKDCQDSHNDMLQAKDDRIKELEKQVAELNGKRKADGESR